MQRELANLDSAVTYAALAQFIAPPARRGLSTVVNNVGTRLQDLLLFRGRLGDWHFPDFAHLAKGSSDLASMRPLWPNLGFSCITWASYWPHLGLILA
jgi:hypothetical protein